MVFNHNNKGVNMYINNKIPDDIWFLNQARNHAKSNNLYQIFISQYLAYRKGWYDDNSGYDYKNSVQLCINKVFEYLNLSF